jgi:hypothetical protein
VCDLLLLFPAFYLFCHRFYAAHHSPSRRMIAFVVLLGWPALILIDHGHFQYALISVSESILVSF